MYTKKVLCAVAVIAGIVIMASLIACGSSAAGMEQVDGHYPANLRTIRNNTGTLWGTSEGATVRRDRNGLFLTGTGTWGVNFWRTFSEESTVTLSFDLKNNVKGSANADWVTMYVGFRLTSPEAPPLVAAGGGGVWMAINHDRGLGLRGNGWLETNYIDLPYSLLEWRRIRIEDNRVENVIRIYIADDNGTEQQMGKLTINGDTLMLYTSEDSETPVITQNVGTVLMEKGYTRMWNHHQRGVRIANLVIEGDEDTTVTPYIASDPLKLRDVYSDTWVAVDDLGRMTEPYGMPGINAPQDMKMGIFYLTWFDHNFTVFNDDKTKIYNEGGVDAIIQFLTDGPWGELEFWAEPYFGFYRSEDRWIIRRHALQLVDMGVDFIFLDATNNVFYTRPYNAIFEEYRKMRDEGLMTPQIAFFLAGDNVLFSRNMLFAAWDTYYRDGRYNDLWVYLDGKPLIIGRIREGDEAIKAQFTNRESWAHNEWTGNGRGKWPWAALYPQLPGRDFDGNIEQLVVMCGGWPWGSTGRSYTTAYGQPTDGLRAFEFELKSAGHGLMFDEHWKRLDEIQAKYIMITGWNEWTAAKWPFTNVWWANTYYIDFTTYRNGMYVDAFNGEFSRDIEPMKLGPDEGGYGDNYLYQTSQNIRKYKGARPVPAAFGQKTVNIHGGFEQWNSVGPEYRDTSGDTTKRHSPGYGDYTVIYTNDTGRNDIITAKVSDGGDGYLYFYVKCADEITSPEGTNWMNLFINADMYYSDGWYGFNFLLNRYQGSGQNAGKVSIETTNSGWNWRETGWADYKVEGSELMIQVALSDLPGLNPNTGFDFKWADNSVASGRIMEFMDLGDTAPNDRFNFRYTKTATPQPLADIIENFLTDGVFVFKANGYQVFNGNKREMLDTTNTNAVAMGEDGMVYLPLPYARDVIPYDIANSETKTINGIEYVRINEAVRAAGRMMTITNKGVIILAPVTVNDEVLQDMLFAYM